MYQFWNKSKHLFRFFVSSVLWLRQNNKSTTVVVGKGHKLCWGPRVTRIWLLSPRTLATAKTTVEELSPSSFPFRNVFQPTLWCCGHHFFFGWGLSNAFPPAICMLPWDLMNLERKSLFLPGQIRFRWCLVQNCIAIALLAPLRRRQKRVGWALSRISPFSLTYLWCASEELSLSLALLLRRRWRSR